MQNKLLFNRVFPALLFLCVVHILPGQSGGSSSPGLVQRFTWKGSDYALRYEVIFEREEGGRYQPMLSEFTEDSFIELSLLPGKYRLRVIPYDFRDMPGEGTRWRSFEIRPARIQEEKEEGAAPAVFNLEEGGDEDELEPEGAETGETGGAESISSPDSINTWGLGAGMGSTFSEPWFVLRVSASYTLQRSFFEAGIDAGFLTSDSDVGFFSLYPYLHYNFRLLPLGENGMAYLGAGGGYYTARYTFPEGDVQVNTFAVDASCGVRFNNGLTVSYTYRTDFATSSNTVVVGYVHSFRGR